jgi:murein DD-endopeptidase MepM/ murein hydrolase activator NlpD
MIFYPYNILNEDIYPVFGDQIKGIPVYVDLVSDAADRIDLTLPLEKTTKYLFDEIKKTGRQWGFSGYLEDRSRVLKTTKIFDEGRIYHIGIDLFVPVGTKLHAPLEGQVVNAEYEGEVTGYGGMIVLKHSVNEAVFYSLYGHLNKTFLPQIGQVIKRGEIFGKIGDIHENGSWTPHLHLQTFTEEGYNGGWLYKGYCMKKDAIGIDRYCPNPIFMLRYSDFTFNSRQ